MADYQESVMPFGPCDHCFRVLLLDPALLSTGSCADCQQPLQLVDRECWQHVQERRRQRAAQLARVSPELMRTSRQLIAESGALWRRHAVTSVTKDRG